MTTTAGPLPALCDISVDPVPGVRRIENMPKDDAQPVVMDMMRSVYPHERVYGAFIPVQSYIAAPPRGVYEYLADTRSLEEWTYGLRGFQETETPGLWVSDDRLTDPHPSKCYCRTVATPDAMTVDYHCAWDQGEDLWMIYLMRVIDAQVVLNKPGSVVTWINCRHPFYDENPYPHTAPTGRKEWVGDFWDMFSAGHQLELDNLKAICEYRAAHGLPVKPAWME
jgi:hypothetical protein